MTLQITATKTSPVYEEANQKAAETAGDVVRDYADTVYALALSQTHSRTDADDVFQEVFLAYARKNPKFESEEHRKAWFLRVTVNCCKKLWRYRKRHKTEPLEAAVLLETQEESDLFGELKHLPEKYRAVLHLFYFEDMSTEKIAQALHITPGAVRTRLSRARELLRKRLEDDF